MPLSLCIYDALFPNGNLLLDATPFASGTTISSGERGYESLSTTIDIDLFAAFRYYDQPGLLYVRLSSGDTLYWEGRLEDPTVWTSEQGSGLKLTALGYSRSMSDIPYTALWSITDATLWKTMSELDLSFYIPSRYAIDTNNRLYLAPQRGASYANAGANFAIAGLYYQIPSGSSRQIVGISFEYVANLPAGWEWGVVTRAAPSAAGTAQFTQAGGIGATTGARHLTFTGDNLVQLYLYYNGAGTTFAGETGTSYVRITSVRIVTTLTNQVSTTHTVARGAGVNVTATVGSTARMYVGQRLGIGATGATLGEVVTVKQILSSTQFVADFAAAAAIGVPVTAFVVYADEVAKDLVGTIAALNVTQLSSATTLIGSPAVDLFNESYEDRAPSDILTYLAGLGDTLGQQWEWGVFDAQQLYFRVRSSAAQMWYVDASDLQSARSIDALYNSVYADYQDASGTTLRGAVASDSASITRYGLTRRHAIQAQTTSSVQATYQRDASLNDTKDPLPQVGITFSALYDASGGRWPLASCRAGDTIVIRNLPPTLSSAIDRIRSFRISRVEVNIDMDTIRVEPEAPIATLTTMLVRLAAGLSTALPAAAARPGTILPTPHGAGV